MVLCGRVQQMGGLRTGLRPVHIVATSKMVSDYSGMMVQPHKVLRAPALAVSGPKQ